MYLSEILLAGISNFLFYAHIFHTRFTTLASCTHTHTHIGTGFACTGLVRLVQALAPVMRNYHLQLRRVVFVKQHVANNTNAQLNESSNCRWTRKTDYLDPIWTPQYPLMWGDGRASSRDKPIIFRSTTTCYGGGSRSVVDISRLEFDMLI